MWLKVEVVNDLFGNFAAFLIDLFDREGCDAQASFRHSATDTSQHGIKSAQREAHVIALGRGQAMLRTFNPTELLEAAMVRFNAPHPHSFIGTPFDRHRDVAGRPAFCAAVWNRELEDFDHTVTFEMNEQAMTRNQHLAKWLIARTGRIQQ